MEFRLANDEQNLPHLDERQQAIVERSRSWSNQAMLVTCMAIYIVAPLFDWLDARTAVVVVVAITGTVEILGLVRQRAYKEIGEVQRERFFRPRALALFSACLMLSIWLTHAFETGELSLRVILLNLVFSAFAAAMIYVVLRRTHRQELRYERERLARGESWDHEHGRRVGAAIARFLRRIWK